MPVFDPELDVLAAAIESVRKQVYENWQLCIADDASTQPYVRPFLTKIAAEDARAHAIRGETVKMTAAAIAPARPSSCRPERCTHRGQARKFRA